MKPDDWPESFRLVVDKGFRAIEADPASLLDGHGGPEGATADVVVGRLYGWDEQLDDEWVLRRAEAVLLRPIPAPRRLLMPTPDGGVFAPMRTAEYRLQRCFSRLNVAAEYAPRGVGHDGSFLTSVLCLRYRRCDRLPGT